MFTTSIYFINVSHCIPIVSCSFPQQMGTSSNTEGRGAKQKYMPQAPKILNIPPNISIQNWTQMDEKHFPVQSLDRDFHGGRPQHDRTGNQGWSAEVRFYGGRFLK